MGGPEKLREQKRKRIRVPQRVQPLPGRSATRPLSTPGPLGKNDAAELLAQPIGLPPLAIHLDLAEIVELNEIVEHARSGIIARGSGFARDQKRPQKVLAIVTSLFGPLGKRVAIHLGSGSKSQRFLKAAFAWGHDPDIGGVSAKGITRTRLGKFNRMGADQSKPVTGYIFEGVIGNWMIEYLGGKADINNLLGTIIAHELGHQLGLGHTKLAQDIMFGFGDGSRTGRTKWLQLAQKKALKFSQPQIATMKSLLSKP